MQHANIFLFNECVIIRAILFFLPVPTAAPTDMIAFPLTSTSVKLTWKPILEKFRNGRVLGYKMGYWKLGTNDITNTTLPINKLEQTITGLDKFTSYRIFILGYTSKGDGVKGVVKVTTKEERKYEFLEL